MNPAQMPEITQELWDAYDKYTSSKKELKKITKHLTPLLDNLARSLRIQKDLKVDGKLLEEGTVTCENDVYMASEEDAKLYYEKANALYKEEGYEVELNYCPILIARSKNIDAAKELIEESFYLVKNTGLSKDSLYLSVENFNEYVETTCRFLKTFGMQYRIDEGFHHNKSVPIYRVLGINNDYIGEWHKEKSVAEAEKRTL